MMNYIWAGMIVLSFIAAIFTGNISELSSSVVTGASKAVELLISILGIICFWSGMMEVAKRSGLTDLLARMFSPVLRLLFPHIPKGSPAMKSMSLNISANLLGIGNAATPFGIEAMRELKRLHEDDDTASDDMVLFVVLNTASLQLIPTTVAAYRQSYGSNSPFDIMPAVWVTSLTALLIGVTAARTLSSLRIGKRDRKLKARAKAWN
ncbi:MAG: nucleoside recognition domain-containing protein [Eubacteriales bacterium]|nr:nucleoside recognition domain-containing protein [Eubacteriales bacterium]